MWRSNREIENASDEELVRLVADRSTKAFDELYRRHASVVTTVALRMSGDRGVADDVTQTTFMSLWNRAGSLDTSGARMRAWLLRVARNAAIDRGRRTARLKVLPLDAASHSVSNELGPEEMSIRLDGTKRVERALQTLIEEQRAVVELAYFGGLTQREIAGVLDQPLGTVKSRIRLAMQKLRSELAPLRTLEEQS